MENLTFEIKQPVLETWPDIMVGGFVVQNLRQVANRLQESEVYIEAACQALLQRGITVQNLTEEPGIKGWRQAFQKMGLKPSTYKSSVEQLARRFSKGEGISTPLQLVNLYCAISVKHLAPMGGYDIARLPSKEIQLRFASSESDTFQPLGGRPEDMPLFPQIVVYACGEEVICWGFNHRDSKVTSLEQNTDSAVFFSEGVYPGQHPALDNALTELRTILEVHGAQVSAIYFATSGEPKIAIQLCG